MKKEKPDISDLEDRSLFSLLADLPRLLSSQIRNEFELLKREVISKGKQFGVGTILLLVSIPVIVLAFIMLIISGMYALSLVMHPWLAALVVAGALLVVAAILIVIALLSFKRFSSPLPKRTLESLQDDIDTISGKNS